MLNQGPSHGFSALLGLYKGACPVAIKLLDNEMLGIEEAV